MFEKTLIHPRSWWRFAVVAALALLLPAAAADEATTSELLEEAVFQEETVGDLDAAIEIYQRIADHARARRPLTARALYRLYRCLDRKGEDLQATLVLGRLRNEYPDYEEILAGETEDLPRSLLLEPAPWPEDEVQVLVVRLAAGTELGPLITSAHRSVVDGDEVWRLGVRRFYGSPENQGNTVIEARRSDFTPVRTRFFRHQIGRFEVDYLPGEVVFHTLGEEGGRRDRTLKVGRPVYDSEMLFHLLRRLPLEVGYKTAVPVISILGEMVDLTVEVTSREEVEVAAGTFECFRLEMPLAAQTHYISTGPRRELVQIEAPGLTVQLAETFEQRPDEPFTYRDSELGYAVTVPGRWHVYRFGCPGSNQRVSIQLLDPDADMRLGCVEAVPLAGSSDRDPRSLAQGSIDYNSSRIAGLVVDEKSWNDRQVGARPATTWISYHDQGEASIARHETVVAGETHFLKLTFITTRERFDAQREVFDEIADGLVIR